MVGQVATHVRWGGVVLSSGEGKCGRADCGQELASIEPTHEARCLSVYPALGGEERPHDALKLRRLLGPQRLGEPAIRLERDLADPRRQDGTPGPFLPYVDR